MSISNEQCLKDANFIYNSVKKIGKQPFSVETVEATLKSFTNLVEKYNAAGMVSAAYSMELFFRPSNLLRSAIKKKNSDMMYYFMEKYPGSLCWGLGVTAIEVKNTEALKSVLAIGLEKQHMEYLVKHENMKIYPEAALALVAGGADPTMVGKKMLYDSFNRLCPEEWKILCIKLIEAGASEKSLERYWS